MKGTKNSRKILATMLHGMILCIVIVVLLQIIGCGQKKNNEIETKTLLPDVDKILSQIEKRNEDIQTENDVEAVLPVKVFMDNTGSMKGYTYNESGKSNSPCKDYRILMRVIRDMGRMQDAKYYVLDGESKDWILYEDDFYENFSRKDLYINWPYKKGPLTKLYMKKKLDSRSINIVFSDLAEQNLNNTALAENIQEMCNESDCEVDLYAFKFNFNGETQVPDPSASSKMLEKKIDNEKKPFYMIISGPSDMMDQYRQGLRMLLENEDLKVNKDYFIASSKISLDQNKISLDQVKFFPFADFDAIREERDEDKREDGKKENTEEKSVNVKKYSKNLSPYEEIKSLFENNQQYEMKAYEYRKVEGVSKDQSDWRLLFHVPLNGKDMSEVSYDYDYQIYTLSNPQGESKKGTKRDWVENEKSGIKVSGNLLKKDGKFYFSISGEVNEKNISSIDTALVKLNIYKNESVIYRIPKWVKKFDTGNTDNYYTKTYNLIGFYCVLFCNGEVIRVNEETEYKTDYVQIPILLTGLDG